MQPLTGSYFVTGTDTGVGKTWWTVRLLQTAARANKRVLGLKPIAAGAFRTPLGLRNDDATALQAASTVALPYEQINPICLPLPASPHLAARAAGVEIDSHQLALELRRVAARADLTLIEGAGGWLAPISEQETMADLARHLGAPVLLVVGLRLGCLNHALLTAESIAAHGLQLAGWIANELSADHGNRRAQIDFLARKFALPPLAEASMLAS